MSGDGGMARVVPCTVRSHVCVWGRRSTGPGPGEVPVWLGVMHHG